MVFVLRLLAFIYFFPKFSIIKKIHRWILLQPLPRASRDNSLPYHARNSEKWTTFTKLHKTALVTLHARLFCPDLLKSYWVHVPSLFQITWDELDAWNRLEELKVHLCIALALERTISHRCCWRNRTTLLEHNVEELRLLQAIRWASSQSFQPQSHRRCKLQSVLQVKCALEGLDLTFMQLHWLVCACMWVVLWCLGRWQRKVRQTSSIVRWETL